MSKVRFIADLHFGHKTIHTKGGVHRGSCSSVEEHDKWLIDRWNSVVSKNDLVWVLGDVAMNYEGLLLLKKCRGVKHLIFGNHDDLGLPKYLEVFNKVHGFMKYKGFWLSHAPIRESSLRGLGNIHGHTHHSSIVDGLNFRHLCVSVEALGGQPIEFDRLKEIYQYHNKEVTSEEGN